MLYIVATPIGNVKEITLRALETLKSVDLIAAEDTRHTAILLNEYDIKKQMISYRKFNERASLDKIIEDLSEGKDVALVSDAGVPLISDPGSVLTKELIERDIPFTVVGCPCACISALVLSGMDTSSFAMYGFLPEKNSDRQKLLESCSAVSSTLIFYSSVHNVDDDLNHLYEALGSRKVAIVREISKVFEEVKRCTLGEIPEFVHKGEFVLVVEGGKKDYSRLTIREHYESYIRQGLDKKEAMRRVAADRGVRRSEIYGEIVKGEG